MVNILVRKNSCFLMTAIQNVVFGEINILSTINSINIMVYMLIILIYTGYHFELYPHKDDALIAYNLCICNSLKKYIRIPKSLEIHNYFEQQYIQCGGFRSSGYH